MPELRQTKAISEAFQSYLPTCMLPVARHGIAKRCFLQRDVVGGNIEQKWPEACALESANCYWQRVRKAVSDFRTLDNGHVH